MTGTASLGWLPVLDRKLLRELWRLRGPALAIALVIAAGVGMVMMSVGMMRSLEATRDAYYDRYRFADVFAPAKRVPMALLPELAHLPGVRTSEGRITMSALIDLPYVSDPINARLHSLPAKGRPHINDLVLRAGRWPDPARPDELLANEAFLKAAKLGLGDDITVILNGKRRAFRIVGAVLSPEYVYAIPPGQIFPDNARFGVLWLQEEVLAGAFDLRHAFNELLVRVDPGTNVADVIRRIDDRLQPYGGIGGYARDQQISDRFVTNELNELRNMTRILPPVFLLVAAFLTHLVLSRLIDTEREVIGLLKAFGFRNRAIIAHYLKLAILLSLGGLILGATLGIWLGRGLARLYQQFFVFPFLQFHMDADLFLMALLAALFPVLTGCFIAIRRAAALTPAAAMSPPMPTNYGGRLTGALTQLRSLDQLTRIILRGLARRPVRTLLTAIGIGAALALYIASASSRDNVEEMIRITFNQAEREDLLVTFTEPRGRDALTALARLPGIRRVEPVRAVSVVLTHQGISRREAITATDPGADLSRLIDINGTVVEPPIQGLVLSASLARQLKVGLGSAVEVAVTQGRRPRWQSHVVAVVDSAIGSPAYMRLDELDRRMMEGPRISGAFLAIDTDARAAILKALRETPAIAGITEVEASRLALRNTIAETMGIITLFNTGFAGLIVFGVIYNHARVALAERSRDLASLRVLGFRTTEVAYLLIGELMLLTLIALPLGIAMGIGLAHYIVSAFGGDLFTIPYALSIGTMARAVLVVMTAAGATAYLVSRRLGQLDLVAVLMTRD